MQRVQLILCKRGEECKLIDTVTLTIGEYHDNHRSTTGFVFKFGDGVTCSYS